MNRISRLASLIVVATAANPVMAQTPLGSSITYQGQLKASGSLGNGNFNMEFRLYDSLAGGSQVGPTLTNPAVPVVDGVFTAALDFGTAAFTGDSRWLEIRVNGTPLSPRQELTAAPYAHFAASAGGPWVTSGPNLSYTAGNVGVGTATPSAPFHVGGWMKIDGANTLEFGANVPSKENNAGKIGYQTFSTDSLDIVGAGTSGTDRKIRFWAEGGASFAGRVGVGTATPSRLLTVGSNSTPDSEGIIRLESRSGTGLASRTWEIGVPETDDDLLGLGYSFVIDDLQFGTSPEFVIAWGTGNVGIGTASPAAKLDVVGVTRTQVLEVTGGADIAEPFHVNLDDCDSPDAAQRIEPGMVVSIDPKRVGELIISANAYDRTVAGIISGAGGVKPGMTLQQIGTIADGKHAVALTGRVYCWVDADAGGAVNPGDMLTTSTTPGHAMRVNDHAAAQGASIGKAMSALPSGKGLVLVLVNLQ